MTADRGGGRPFCRRCLLEAVPDAEALRATMRAWRAAIPPEQRADEALYLDKARLKGSRSVGMHG